MPITTQGKRRTVRIECAGQPLPTGPEPDRVTPWSELHIPVFDDRNAVLRVVVPVAAADIGIRTGP
jgi:hypothetical protein